MVNKLKHLEEWQETVGDCRIGKGLSYQCEIEQVVEDTFDYGVEEGAKSSAKQIAELQFALAKIKAEIAPQLDKDGKPIPFRNYVHHIKGGI